VTRGAPNAQVVVGMYQPIAADYEEIWAPLLRPYGLRLLDMLELRDARRVLDLGCGVGRLLPDILERAPHAHVIGTDITEGMIRRADPRCDRIVMDAMVPALADSCLDAVVSSFVVFHIPDPRLALEGVRRAVRPGGRVALAVWGDEASCPALDVWNAELDAAGVPEDPAAEGQRDGEELVNSPQKMRSVLEDAGYVEVTAEPAAWAQGWTVQGFIDWRTRLGVGRRRLGQLTPEHRAKVVAAARHRLESLPPEDLVDHDVVVLASGVAPG
jgi:SAM-dependent methyltransferase